MKFPADLIISTILALAAMVFILGPFLSNLPVRIPLGLVMVLFLPGYTLIAALFPHKEDLDSIERFALSLGLSIAVVPLTGLGLNYTPWGIRLTSVVIFLTSFTLAMSLAAYYRRASLLAEDRFSVEFYKGFEAVKNELNKEGSGRLDRPLTVLLILSILLSIAALIYVIVTPKQGEKFTEFYVLGPNGTTSNYPISVVPGSNSTVIVGIANHEGYDINYTFQIALENLTLVNHYIMLEDNEIWKYPVTYKVDRPIDQEKLQFLLYKDSNFTAPYRELHLWLNVTKPSISPIKSTKTAYTIDGTNFVSKERMEQNIKLGLRKRGDYKEVQVPLGTPIAAVSSR